MHLQPSAQPQIHEPPTTRNVAVDQSETVHNDIRAADKTDRKAAKTNKHSAFAKLLDALLNKQSKEVVDQGEVADKGKNAQLVAAQKKSLQGREHEQNQKTLLSIDSAEKSLLAEQKKSSSKKQQNGDDIEAVFVHRVVSKDTADKPATKGEVFTATEKIFANTKDAPPAAKSEKLTLAGKTPDTEADASATLTTLKATPDISKTTTAETASAVNTSDKKESAHKAAMANESEAFSAAALPAAEKISDADNPASLLASAETSAQDSAESVSEKAAKSKRRDRLTVEVQDARTPTASAAQTAQTARFSPSDASVIDITLDLSRAQDMPDGGAPAADKISAGRNFADMLSRTLTDGGLATDIVRQAVITLRNGGEGVIRLSLKPETLGSVKIQLDLAENKITGTILVENEETLKAFQREVHTLEQAFKDSGFESASLNTTFSGAQDGGQQDNLDSTPFFSERFVAESYGALEETASFSDFLDNGYESAAAPINMLA